MRGRRGGERLRRRSDGERGRRPRRPRRPQAGTGRSWLDPPRRAVGTPHHGLGAEGPRVQPPGAGAGAARRPPTPMSRCTARQAAQLDEHRCERDAALLGVGVSSVGLDETPTESATPGPPTGAARGAAATEVGARGTPGRHRR